MISESYKFRGVTLPQVKASVAQDNNRTNAPAVANHARGGGGIGGGGHSAVGRSPGRGGAAHMVGMGNSNNR